MRRRKQLSKFTYGARAIEREQEIGFWENLLGVALLCGAVSLYCIGYFVVVVAGIGAFLFGGWYVFFKLGLV